jgi:hypothetical protein
MAKTYEPIATTTLGSAAASITFSSIPATYTDLNNCFIAGKRFGVLTSCKVMDTGQTILELRYGNGTAAILL